MFKILCEFLEIHRKYIIWCSLWGFILSKHIILCVLFPLLFLFCFHSTISSYIYLISLKQFYISFFILTFLHFSSFLRILTYCALGSSGFPSTYNSVPSSWKAWTLLKFGPFVIFPNVSSNKILSEIPMWVLMTI